jgi:hypothetical protein
LSGSANAGAVVALADFPRSAPGGLGRATGLVLNCRGPQKAVAIDGNTARVTTPRNEEPDIDLGCGPTHRRIPRGGINQGRPTWEDREHTTPNVIHRRMNVLNRNEKLPQTRDTVSYC